MRFQFRLEKMLSFIRLKETTKKMEVAACLAKLGYLRRKKDALVENIRSILGSTYANGYFDLANTVYLTKQIEIDKSEGERLDRYIREEENVLRKKQSELSRLVMRKKGLESLKERRREEFRLQESRKEQKRIDEAYELTRQREVTRKVA